MKKRKSWINKSLEFFIITVSTLVMAAGIYFFEFPNNFTFGGVTGVSVVLSELTDISASTFTFTINMALIVIGFIFLGKKAGLNTVYVSILLSVSISFLNWLIPMSGPLTDEPVLELIFAIAIPSFASAILFNLGASSGGTDIVAMILKKYVNINIATALFIVDLIITTSACFVFDIKTGLYSFCGLVCKSVVIDVVIENVNMCKYFTIVSENPDVICKYIHNELHRSATTFYAEGSYSHKKEVVILTVLKRGQAIALRNFIKTNEPTAFIMITNSSEIIGKGFRGF